MHLIRNTLILAFAAVIAGCGDEKASSDTAAPAVAAAPAEQAKPAIHADLMPVELTPMSVVSTDRYQDAMAPMVLVSLYHTFRKKDESAEEIAASMGGNLAYEGFPPALIELVRKHSGTHDAFQKKDLAKAVADEVVKVRSSDDDRRLKVDFHARDVVFTSYDFDRRGFQIGSTLFFPEASQTPSSWDTGSRSFYGAKPVRSYIGIPPSSYKLGFVNAEGIRFLEVENEEVARKIESLRQQLRVVIYGSAVQIYRDYKLGSEAAQPLAGRYVIMQPQRLELLDPQDKVIYAKDL